MGRTSLAMIMARARQIESEANRQRFFDGVASPSVVTSRARAFQMSVKRAIR